MNPIGRNNSLGSGTSLDTGNQFNRLATEAAQQMDLANYNQAFSRQNQTNALGDDSDISWDDEYNKGEPMDMAFRLLKMMAFYR